jgi:transcriptional regulator with XRE-family HTH domain
MLHCGIHHFVEWINVTQEQVLNDTGIHIARIEQGKRDVSYTTLVKLAQYFEVGLDSFM